MIKLTPIQVQKTILAPSMQQSIEILLLPITELTTAIDLELQENPLLDIDEKKSELERSQIEHILKSKLSRDTDKSYLPAYEHNGDDEEHESRPITKTPPLEDHLIQQLRLEINDPLHLKIGELIIGELNEDGYFKSSLEEVALLLSLHSTDAVEKVLKIIQTFEPPGIASRNLRECLSIQAEERFNGKADLLKKIINNYLQELGNKRYHTIARALNISPERVKEIGQLIATLEPKPARNFRPINENIYIKPDVIVVKDAQGNYQVFLNKENIPKLRINKYYKDMLDIPNLSVEERDFIHNKVKNALLFMKSIEQRGHTIKEIAKYIVDHQKDFFEEGHLSLKPLRLKDIAEAIHRNESTVSRAINHKYMDTPQGLFAIKYFFSQGLSNQGEKTNVTNRGLKEEMKELIEQENKEKPLSDQAIRLYFEKKNMKVARRTITKYRQALKILPSHLRKI